MEPCSTTYLTCQSLNLSIHLGFCSHLVFLASVGSESVSATASFCWELTELEWRVTVINTLLLEILVYWELTGPDAGVDRGLSTHGDDEEEVNERLVCAVTTVSSGQF